MLNIELERAVANGNLENVKALLSAGADANHRPAEWNRNRDTLLHNTTNVDIIKQLLLSGAEINATNMYRETPLHSAITLGRELELVRTLLKHGADVNATNRKGNTALNHAVKRSSSLEIIKELLKYGADINIRNREQSAYEDCYTSLDNAVLRNLEEYAKLLIKFTLIRNFNKDYGKIIDLSPYKGRNSYSQLSNYLDDCICEILQMKTDEIKTNHPLYEFVTNNFNVHVLCNNQLSVRLAKIDYSIRYPIYNDIILDRIKPFSERADLLNKLSQIQFYTKLDQDVKGKKIILDHDSTYNISEYLSNNDLLNFIVAFDNSNKSTLESSHSSDNLVEPDIKLYETSSSNDTKRLRLE